MLASVLSYVSGRTLKKPLPENTFLPDYLGEHTEQPTANKTLEQQEQEMKAFADKLRTLTGKR